MASGWAGSTRRQRLPHDWPTRRAAVLHRDQGRCTWVHNGTRCTEPATDVDHIDRLLGHDLTNLRALCRWHHARKTAAEGNAQRWQGGNPQRSAGGSRRRKPERHPGLLD